MLAQISHIRSNNQPTEMEIVTSLQGFTRALVHQLATGTVKTYGFVTLIHATFLPLKDYISFNLTSLKKQCSQAQVQTTKNQIKVKIQIKFSLSKFTSSQCLWNKFPCIHSIRIYYRQENKLRSTLSKIL